MEAVAFPHQLETCQNFGLSQEQSSSLTQLDAEEAPSEELGI